MRTAHWVSAAAGLAALLMATPSFADGPATAGVLQLGLGFRYGAELNDGDFNPWGTGLGLEVGYTLPILPIYVGGNVEYFFGGTLDSPVGKIEGNIWQATAEGGYDIAAGDHLVIRPKLGLGYANVTSETCVSILGCGTTHDNQGLVAPGAKFILMFSRLQLAFDGRYAVVLSDPKAKAFIFSMGIGF